MNGTSFICTAIAPVCSCSPDGFAGGSGPSSRRRVLVRCTGAGARQLLTPFLQYNFSSRLPRRIPPPALHKGIALSGRPASSFPAVAVVVMQELRLAVYDADGPLMTGIGAQPAARAFFFVIWMIFRTISFPSFTEFTS
jgi:hypothetical protein